jgi:hypothetical protein
MGLPLPPTTVAKKSQLPEKTAAAVVQVCLINIK